jgi:hypothetical protein
MSAAKKESHSRTLKDKRRAMADLAAGAVGYLPTVLKYLNPVRSPFYTVMVVATFLICYCHRHLIGEDATLTPHQFFAFSAPIVAVMGLGLYVSLKPRAEDELKPKEHKEQIRFTRSFCISVGLICIVWVGQNFQLLTVEGGVSYYSCLTQIIVFTVYTILRLGKDEPPTRSNLIQLGLITGAFMLGFSYCLQLKPVVPQPIYLLNLPAAFWILYVAWLICIYKWIKHFVSIVQINVTE